MPWTAAYIDSIGDPACDLRSNIAAEARAKIVYERLTNVTTDPGINDALWFLMAGNSASEILRKGALFDGAELPAWEACPGMAPFADLYVNASQGTGDAEGPWNTGEQWERIDNVVSCLRLHETPYLGVHQTGSSSNDCDAALLNGLP